MGGWNTTTRRSVGRAGRHGGLFLSALLLLVLAARAAVSQETDWPLDEVRLRDGTVYRGLVQVQDEQTVEFAEIVRPAGKPMHAVIRPLARNRIARVETVRGADRIRLIERFEAFRHRARIESERMENLQLRVVREASVAAPAAGARQAAAARDVYLYKGPWFQLRSTSDEQTTRQSVVRIEQMFRAYRQLLPPRPVADASRPLEILLFGSMDEYRQYLHDRRLAVEASAFYSARNNTIVAGSDLVRYSRWLESLQQQNDQQRQRYDQLDDEFDDRFAERAAQMKAAGYSRKEIKFERQIRLAAWQRELRAMRDKLDQNQRDNESKLRSVSRAMFTRLYHEAFHAYLENYVFPQRDYHVPRWLNEGLAQLFEAGRLDGDLLRVDAPDLEKLEQLRQELRQNPLSLSDVLAARHDSFLVTHSPDASYRHYLYAWGLAYYLAFDPSAFEHASFEEGGGARGPEVPAGSASLARMSQFVQPREATETSAIQRFEAWTGRPLAEFEKAWRHAMLELK